MSNVPAAVGTGAAVIGGVCIQTTPDPGLGGQTASRILLRAHTLFKIWDRDYLHARNITIHEGKGRPVELKV